MYSTSMSPVPVAWAPVQHVHGSVIGVGVTAGGSLEQHVVGALVPWSGALVHACTAVEKPENGFFV